MAHDSSAPLNEQLFYTTPGLGEYLRGEQPPDQPLEEIPLFPKPDLPTLSNNSQR